MASSRQQFLYRLHLTAFTIVATLTAVVAWLLLPQGGTAILRARSRQSRSRWNS